MVTEETLEGGGEFLLLRSLLVKVARVMRLGILYLFGTLRLARRFALALYFVRMRAPGVNTCTTYHIDRSTIKYWFS